MKCKVAHPRREGIKGEKTYSSTVSSSGLVLNEWSKSNPGILDYYYYYYYYYYLVAGVWLVVEEYGSPTKHYLFIIQLKTVEIYNIC